MIDYLGGRDLSCAHGGIKEGKTPSRRGASVVHVPFTLTKKIREIAVVGKQDAPCNAVVSGTKLNTPYFLQKLCRIV